jgi:hypothetical protein
MPIYLFEPDKPMRPVQRLPPYTDALAKSYAYIVFLNTGVTTFCVFSPRSEDWLEIKPEGVPPEYRAMALLIPTS